jgi:hypothetical protein
LDTPWPTNSCYFHAHISFHSRFQSFWMYFSISMLNIYNSNVTLLFFQMKKHHPIFRQTLVFSSQKSLLKLQIMFLYVNRSPGYSCTICIQTCLQFLKQDNIFFVEDLTSIIPTKFVSNWPLTKLFHIPSHSLLILLFYFYLKLIFFLGFRMPIWVKTLFSSTDSNVSVSFCYHFVIQTCLQFLKQDNIFFVEDLTSIIPTKFVSNWPSRFRGDYQNVQW